MENTTTNPKTETMTIVEARSILDAQAGTIVAFVSPANFQALGKANDVVIDDYDARRAAAAKAILFGLDPVAAARRFRVPVGYCRNLVR